MYGKYSNCCYKFTLLIRNYRTMESLGKREKWLLMFGYPKEVGVGWDSRLQRGRLNGERPQWSKALYNQQILS